MEVELYRGLIDYLGSLQLPSHATQSVQREIGKTANNYFLRNNILYRKHHGKQLLVVPEHKKHEILSASHDHHMAGHQGVKNTYQRISGKYYWPTLFEDIRQYIRTCDICQKRRKDRDIEPMQPTAISSAGAHFGIDVVGPLPRTMRGNRYIVVAIDYLTKWTEARAIQLADALTIAPFIYEDIICRHGIPREVTSDRGTEFVNELMATFYQQFNIRHITTTAYHPQANGLVERANQTLKNTISKAVSQHGGDWDLYLPSALFATRTMRQDTTRFTPFELVYGREARQPVDEIIDENRKATEITEETRNIRINQEITRLQQIRHQAQEFISKAQERQKANYDKANKETTILRIGDQVLLFRNVTEASWSAKLEPKWEGPYIVASIKGTTYQLRRTTGTLLPFKVHRNRLKKYAERQLPAYITELPPRHHE